MEVNIDFGWSDANLDELLALDFSDNEFYTDNSSSNASDSESEYIVSNDPAEAVDQSLTARDRTASDTYGSVLAETALTTTEELPKSVTRSQFAYECPVCKKELRSVSAFRGHVMKQHQSFDMIGFKVSDYRRNATGDHQSSDSVSQRASLAEVNISCARSSAAIASFFPYTETTFPESFLSANRIAWKQIIDDPLFLMPSSSKGSVLVELAKSLWNVVDDLKSCSVVVNALKKVFVNRSLVTQSEREKVCVQIQSVRLSESAIQNFVGFVTKYNPSAEVFLCKLLFQVWLRKFVVEILNAASVMHESLESGSKHVVHPLTDVDQNALYFICGYMVMKLKTASKMYKKLKNMNCLIQSLTTKEPKDLSHFVEHYRKLAEQQDRMGLLYPIPELYLLVRELNTIFETVVRVRGVQASSINKVCLQTTMHESFMVNYYWNQIIEMVHQTESSCLPVLDYLVSFFITVKGFATARKELFDHCKRSIAGTNIY